MHRLPNTAGLSTGWEDSDHELMRRRVGRVLWVWGPALTLMAAIFSVSSLPDPPNIPGGMPDVAAHGLAYAALGGLMLRAMTHARWSGVSATRVAAAAAMTMVYGLSDEFHQSFVPGRVADVRDLAADSIGALVSVFLVWACSIVLSSRHPTCR